MPERVVLKKLQEICPSALGEEGYIPVVALPEIFGLPADHIQTCLEKLSNLEFVEFDGDLVRLTMTGRYVRTEER